MSTYDDWKGHTWTVDSVDPKLTDLKCGDSLSFLGTGNKDGNLKRSNVAGTPDWARKCEYLAGDRVAVEHEGEGQYLILRSAGKLICWPPGKAPVADQRLSRHGHNGADGDDGDVTGASWTAHDPGSGVQPCHDPRRSEGVEGSDRGWRA